VCEVDVGQSAPLSIVCGAPNVAPGIVCPARCRVPNCPETCDQGRHDAGCRVERHALLGARTGPSDDHAGLLLLDADAPIGADVRALLELDDSILTIKLTPNRAIALSVVGGRARGLPRFPVRP